MSVEIEVLDSSELVRILNDKAEKSEACAARIEAFFGTEVKLYQHYHNKAVGYKMLADIISSDTRPFQINPQDLELL